MRIELTGPDDDPQVSITMNLVEAYQVQYGCSPSLNTPPEYNAFEKGLFEILKESRRRALKTVTEGGDG